MAELERTAVQLWEAKRLAAYQDVAHGRLALLLLDNAAETSLMRSAKNAMIHTEMYDNLAYLLREVDPDDEEGQRLKAQIEARTLSKRRRQQIEKHFDPLVDYVRDHAEVGLAPEIADCLRILHRYRNAAYHRDHVRPDVLGPAVQTYFFLCCHLLKHERPLVSEIKPMPPSVAVIFGDTPPKASWPGGSLDTVALAGHVADRLLADLELDHGRIAAVLSEHLLARLEALDNDLTIIGESVPPRVTRWATLRLVQQAPRNREEFEADPPEDFWTRPLPVTEETLDAWALAAVDLRALDNAHDALRAFASIEEPLEALEKPVARFIEDIDRAEQQRIDDVRGR